MELLCVGRGLAGRWSRGGRVRRGAPVGAYLTNARGGRRHRPGPRRAGRDPRDAGPRRALPASPFEDVLGPEVATPRDSTDYVVVTATLDDALARGSPRCAGRRRRTSSSWASAGGLQWLVDRACGQGPRLEDGSEPRWPDLVRLLLAALLEALVSALAALLEQRRQRPSSCSAGRSRRARRPGGDGAGAAAALGAAPAPARHRVLLLAFGFRRRRRPHRCCFTGGLGETVSVVVRNAVFVGVSLELGLLVGRARSTPSGPSDARRVPSLLSSSSCLPRTPRGSLSRLGVLVALTVLAALALVAVARALGPAAIEGQALGLALDGRRRGRRPARAGAGRARRGPSGRRGAGVAGRPRASRHFRACSTWSATSSPGPAISLCAPSPPSPASSTCTLTCRRSSRPRQRPSRPSGSRRGTRGPACPKWSAWSFWSRSRWSPCVFCCARSGSSATARTRRPWRSASSSCGRQPRCGRPAAGSPVAWHASSAAGASRRGRGAPRGVPAARAVVAEAAGTHASRRGARGGTWSRCRGGARRRPP